MRAPRNYPFDPARFWIRVDRSNGPDACHLWTGPLNWSGYGACRGPGGVAHRLAYALTIGPIPRGLFICHRCDVPACCNPRHLFAATPGENMHDKARKGRSARMEGHPGARLTIQKITEIRARLAAGEQGRQLAREFGVCDATISAVKSKRTWSNV